MDRREWSVCLKNGNGNREEGRWMDERVWIDGWVGFCLWVIALID